MENTNNPLTSYIKNIENSIEQITIRLNLLDTKINNLHATVNILLSDKMTVSKTNTELHNKKNENINENNNDQLINITKKKTQYRKRIL